MQSILQNHIPEQAIPHVLQLLEHDSLTVLVKKERKTRHGDYRKKPHGIEWKHTFQHLMLPFLNPNVFPQHLLPLLANHFKNPKASSDTDITLALALKKYDAPNDNHYVSQLPVGSIFKLYNGRCFKKGKKRTKRYECIEINTGKVYLFNPNAEVQLLE